MLQTIYLLILHTLLILMAFPTKSQEFELTGQIDPVTFMQFMGSNLPARKDIVISNIVSGNGMVRFPREFRVAVKGGCWMVASTNLDGKVAKYSICEPGFGVANVIRFGDSSRNAQSLEAYLEPEGYPSKAFERGNQLLWFAFASHNYTNATVADLPPPLWDAELFDRPDEKQWRASWKRSDSKAPLPLSAAFFCDGYRSPVPEFRINSNRYRPPYDEGFTNRSYHVLSTTNLNGQIIPMEGVMVDWIPDENSRQQQKAFRPIGLQHFKVQKISPVCTVTQWKPEIKDMMMVRDYRLSKKGVTTSNAVPKKEKPNPGGTNTVSYYEEAMKRYQEGISGMNDPGRVLYRVTNDAGWKNLPEVAQIQTKKEAAKNKTRNTPKLALICAGVLVLPLIIKLSGRWRS